MFEIFKIFGYLFLLLLGTIGEAIKSFKSEVIEPAKADFRATFSRNK